MVSVRDQGDTCWDYMFVAMPRSAGRQTGTHKSNRIFAASGGEAENTHVPDPSDAEGPQESALTDHRMPADENSLAPATPSAASPGILFQKGDGEPRRIKPADLRGRLCPRLPRYAPGQSTTSPTPAERDDVHAAAGLQARENYLCST